MLKFLMFKN